MAELFPKSAIDDEVNGRIRRHNQITDVIIIKIGPAATVRFLVQNVIKQLVDIRRRLTKQKHDHYHDHYQSYVLFLVVASTVSRLWRQRSLT